ncbi:hypothetical protein ACFPPD_21115 [Cohnella suwonensis]|uniref:CBM-cenC domain-containing protein n=1 Tax=Cohnella suwonensis TaxID=696072 RepID=A0ABW0M241_9BACL
MKRLTFKKLRFGMMAVLLSCFMMAPVIRQDEVQAAGIPLSVPGTANLTFEAAVTDPAVVPGWSTYSFYGVDTASVSTEQVYAGSKSMKFVDSSSSASLARISQRFAITPESTYTVSAFAYLEDLVATNSGVIQMWLILYKPSSPSGPDIIQKTEITETAANVGKWINMSATRYAPAGYTEAAILFYSPLSNKTTAYIDEVSIGRTLPNAGFEEELGTSWTVSGAEVSTELEGKRTLKLMDASTSNISSAESSPLPITGNTRVGALARVYYDYATPIRMKLKFITSGGTVTGTEPVKYSGATDEWGSISISANAPANAAFVSVYLETVTSDYSTSYIDDVTLSLPIEYDLGVPITNDFIETAVFGRAQCPVTEQCDLLYAGVSGYPSKLVVYDAHSGELLESRELANTEAVWDMTVASDNSVYIGTANKKRLFRYIPGSYSGGNFTNGTLNEITLETGMEIIWAVAAGSNGSIYGGTSNSGKAFRYDANGTKTNLNGDAPIVADQIVRSIAYASDSEIYMGVGGSAGQVIRFNPTSSGPHPNILPNSATTRYVMGLDYVQYGGLKRVFAKLGSGSTVVLDPAELNLNLPPIATLTGIDSEGISKPYPGGDNVYYTKGNHLYRYDLEANAEAPVGDVGGSARGFAYLKDGSDTYLYAALSSGRILKFNSPSIDIDTSFVLLKAPSKIRSLANGSANKIYAGGFMGGMGVYDANTGLKDLHAFDDQAENITVMGQDLYLGIYPGALIKKYYTADSWNPPTNPATKYQDLTALDQDRPFGMLAVPGLNKLYVGTVPKSEENGGVFSAYRLSDNSVVHHTNIVPDQSVISLAYYPDNNKVFGGTSIHGGIGSTPPSADARVFVANAATDAKITDFVPVIGRKVISDLMVVGDTIWGLAEGGGATPAKGDLFTINPINHTVTAVYADKFDSLAGVSWQGGKMAVGNDGNVYVSIGGKLYAVNIETKAATVVAAGGVTLLTQDQDGDLYYVKNDTKLFKYDK